MIIKFLKAGSGDSILIQHKNHNILVDGGTDTTFLFQELDEIYKVSQSIDLLIITHHDEDHILGITKLLNKLANGEYVQSGNFIKKIIFNSPKRIAAKLPTQNVPLSYRQAYETEVLMGSLNLSWDIYAEDSEPLLFDDLKLTFLSPTTKALQDYIEDPKVYLASDYKCDWNTPMSVLDEFIDDKSQDTSPSNLTSIVLKIECENKIILLTGDVTPGRFEEIIEKILTSTGGKQAVFDYIKLPHHGSYRSLNKSLIEKIKCNNYIISTNSQRYFLPNKRALLKILAGTRSNLDPVRFYFNYNDALLNLKISAQEQNDYNFLLVSNNSKHGFTI